MLSRFESGQCALRGMCTSLYWGGEYDLVQFIAVFLLVVVELGSFAFLFTRPVFRSYEVINLHKLNYSFLQEAILNV